MTASALLLVVILYFGLAMGTMLFSVQVGIVYAQLIDLPPLLPPSNRTSGNEHGPMPDSSSTTGSVPDGNSTSPLPSTEPPVGNASSDQPVPSVQPNSILNTNACLEYDESPMVEILCDVDIY